MEKGEI